MPLIHTFRTQPVLVDFTSTNVLNIAAHKVRPHTVRLETRLTGLAQITSQQCLAPFREGKLSSVISRFNHGYRIHPIKYEPLWQ